MSVRVYDEVFGQVFRLIPAGQNKRDGKEAGSQNPFQWHGLDDLVSFPQTSAPECSDTSQSSLRLLTTPLLWESFGEIFQIQT